MRKIASVWDQKLISGEIGKIITRWCWDYYDKYTRAPGKDFEAIFFKKLKEKKISEELAEEFEQEFLPELSEEYENEGLNVEYLVNETFIYFDQQKLELLSAAVDNLIAKHKLDEAKLLVAEYRPIEVAEKDDIDLADRETLKEVEKAFEESSEPLVSFPRQLGQFWNTSFVRGGFIALMAPEKRYKTFYLMEIALRGAKQGNKVAFFQAGDMTRRQQIKRFAVRLARKSNDETKVGVLWQPVRDCIHNQMGTCQEDCRESDYGPFEGIPEDKIKNETTFADLIEAYNDCIEYKPCWNCSKYWTNKWGAPWIQKVDVGKHPLSVREAKMYWRKFFIKYKRNFRLSTHPNGTLTVNEMRSKLIEWGKSGFVPDIIILDYADLMEDFTKEFRHKQNAVWKGLRGITQEYNALLVTATQADALSYETNILKLKNFSEDKRKYAHVTAMYGLNQDPKGREKKIGILRINKLVLREDDFTVEDQVHVLQNIKRGMPFVSSYFS